MGPDDLDTCRADGEVLRELRQQVNHRIRIACAPMVCGRAEKSDTQNCTFIRGRQAAAARMDNATKVGHQDMSMPRTDTHRRG